MRIRILRWGRPARTVLPILLAVLAGAAALGQTHKAPSRSQVRPLPKLPITAPMAAQGGNAQLLYGGEAPDEARLHLSAWGGGTADMSTDQAYLPGGHSLAIVALGAYAGGQIIFTDPVALGDLAQQPHRYLQIIFHTAPAPGYEEFNSPAGPASPSAPSPGGPRPANPTPSGPSTGSSAELPADPVKSAHLGHLAQYTTPAPQSVEEGSGVPITSLHLTFQLADGAQADIVRTLPQTDATWIHMAIPLSALPFEAPEASNAQLKSMIIAADGPAMLYIGEIRLVDDDTPITAYPLDEQDVATGDEVTFQGDGDGGASALKYSWDFDTKGAFADQADGQTVTHHYPKPGDYKVTLMVGDRDGIKKPAMVTTTVHVED